MWNEYRINENYRKINVNKINMLAIMKLIFYFREKNLLIKQVQIFTRNYFQFNSVAQSCPNLCDLMDCSTPGLPVHHHFPESTQTHVHWASDAIQPFHPLPPTSPPAFNLSQHQRLFLWLAYLHHVAKVLELQVQHQSFLWIFRVNFLYSYSTPIWNLVKGQED